MESEFDVAHIFSKMGPGSTTTNNYVVDGTSEIQLYNQSPVDRLV